MRTHQRIVLARASSALELRQAIAKLDTEVPLRTEAAECFMSNARLPEAFAIFSYIYVMDGSGVWEFTVGRWEHHALQRPGECV